MGQHDRSSSTIFSIVTEKIPSCLQYPRLRYSRELKLELFVNVAREVQSRRFNTLRFVAFEKSGNSFKNFELQSLTSFKLTRSCYQKKDGEIKNRLT